MRSQMLLFMKPRGETVEMKSVPGCKSKSEVIEWRNEGEKGDQGEVRSHMIRMHGSRFMFVCVSMYVRVQGVQGVYFC